MRVGEDCICIEPDDYDQSTIPLTTVYRKARKQHKCDECFAPIVVGETYENVKGKWCDEFTTFKTCIPCTRVRYGFFNCGFVFGSLWSHVHEAVCDGEECVCP